MSPRNLDGWTSVDSGRRVRLCVSFHVFPACFLCGCAHCWLSGVSSDMALLFLKTTPDPITAIKEPISNHNLRYRPTDHTVPDVSNPFSSFPLTLSLNSGGYFGVTTHRYSRDSYRDGLWLVEWRDKWPPHI
ncbi:hypothetical protein CONLIGDRAFT_180971 [Coniochaeta ligniaria NRRL 30616]|uniref:Uncharacterized protein n=1 Tax=Coniochaeta ligniaria NRRL 30616 TaxID=1408157 RepID=A0A1J7JJG0_9PEZI|nr:hypothetical protein CONLIGDRAFT_180971 [Coniochaeta ligniaria NRRL 30616]